MRHLRGLSSIFALVLLTACGGIPAKEKSEGTDTSAQQADDIQFATLSLDASNLTYVVGPGTQLIVSVVPTDQNLADRRELIFALPVSLPLTIARLPAKSYKLSLVMSDPVSNKRLTADSEVLTVSGGVATNLRIDIIIPSCAPSGPCESILTIKELVSSPIVGAL